jgi:hypothetical protein
MIALVAFAALIAGIGARSVWAASGYGLAIGCWVTGLVLAVHLPGYQEQEFAANFATEVARVFAACSLAPFGLALRQFTKYLQRSRGPSQAATP